MFPGLIDCHVHFGMGEKITEYSTETANAAQGGFTTVLGYFLNNEAYGDAWKAADAPDESAGLIWLDAGRIGIVGLHLEHGLVSRMSFKPQAALR